MRSVFIVLTTECDKTGECVHCFYNVEPDRHVPSKLQTRDIKAFLKKMRLLNVPNIYLTGGEPLLRQDIEEIIGFVKELGLRSLMLSNAVSLTAEKAAALDAAGLDAFVLSLSRLDHNDIKTVHNVRRLRRAALSFIFVLTSQNIGRAADVVEMARSLRAGAVFQPVYIPDSHELFEKLSLSRIGPFEWSELYTALRKWAVDYGFEDYLKLMHDFYNKKSLRPSACNMGRDAFVVDADGSVYPCFHRRDLLCGNILSDDIGMIFSKLEKSEPHVKDAACFGEHCISLHTGFRI